MHRILAVNPGSTSTKIAVYQGNTALLTQNLAHDVASLAQFSTTFDQYAFRKEAVMQALAGAGVSLASLDAVVGRGGVIRPLVRGGVYRINALMLEDCRIGYLGNHAANLGAVIANEVGTEQGIPAFVVDPPMVDELDELARVSGHPGLQRRSMFHALNQKATARRAAEELGIEYWQGRFVVAHMGGGITIGAHDLGRVVDVNNGYDAEGPMSPERAGTLPAGDLARLCFSEECTHEEVKRMLVGGGGMVAHLGTNDLRKVREMIASGDRYADLIFRAMAYQVAKEIGSCAAVLRGEVDAIVLTGGLAHDAGFTALIEDRVRWIAPVKIYPGENEMESLAFGALRVLTGSEAAKEYDAGNILEQP